MPPLALQAGDVAAEVDVVRELGERGGGRRPRGHLAGVGELFDVARAAVGAGEEEAHYPVIRNTILLCGTLVRWLGLVNRRGRASALPPARSPRSICSPRAARSE